MTTKTQRINIGNLEGSSTDGFIDAVKGWLNTKAYNCELADYMEFTADATGAWDMPVKPEPFRWSHPKRDEDYMVQLDLCYIEYIEGSGKRIAFYMVELTY